jgi:hypothetical protein
MRLESVVHVGLVISLTYLIHLLKILEESMKVSRFADSVESSIFAHVSAID